MSIEKISDGIFEATVTVREETKRMRIVRISLVPRTNADEQKLRDISSGLRNNRGISLLGEYDEHKGEMNVDVAFYQKS